MNKFVFCTSVSIALFFAACGDDSNSVEPSLDESSSSITESSSSMDSQKTSSSSSEKNSSSAESSSSSKTSLSTERVGEMTDSRDGQTYKTTTIGPQTWMAENLNYETADSYCYKDSTEYCEKYGRLYTWAAAMVACPSGWHLPTTTEFDSLLVAVGGKRDADSKLQSTSGWDDYDGKKRNGTDDYSFSALPAGYSLYGGSFEDYHGENTDAVFWGATEYGGVLASRLKLDHVNGVSLYSYVKVDAYSVRCVKD